MIDGELVGESVGLAEIPFDNDGLGVGDCVLEAWLGWTPTEEDEDTEGAPGTPGAIEVPGETPEDISTEGAADFEGEGSGTPTTDPGDGEGFPDGPTEQSSPVNPSIQLQDPRSVDEEHIPCPLQFDGHVGHMHSGGKKNGSQATSS